MASPATEDRSRRPRRLPGEENVVPIGLEIESSREQGNTVPTGQPLQISRCQQPVRNDVEAEAGDVLVSAIGEYCGIAQANTVTAEIGIENYDGLNHDDDGQYSRLLEIDEKYFVVLGKSASSLRVTGVKMRAWVFWKDHLKQGLCG